ncbi:hypothetical protein SDC9_92129 [bioreactor metagenome]|uniref:Uncharacterized protein n=1 Tax=bioreactor metagenome TaxID=1076179 RepID=A0A644ZX87_9ZZZZ
MRHALGNELAQGVDVVGVVAHDVAALVRVKILHGQTLHMPKEPLSHFLERALRKNRHCARVGKREDERDEVQPGENHRKANDLRADHAPARARVLLQNGDDVLREDGGHCGDRGGEDDADDHRGQRHGIERKQRAKKALERSFLKLSFWLHSSSPALFWDSYTSR